jgi:hypothetical protein
MRWPPVRLSPASKTASPKRNRSRERPAHPEAQVESGGREQEVDGVAAFSFEEVSSQAKVALEVAGAGFDGGATTEAGSGFAFDVGPLIFGTPRMTRVVSLQLDVLNEKAHLAIELDGPQHLADEEAWRGDRLKHALLQRHGYSSSDSWRPMRESNWTRCWTRSLLPGFNRPYLYSQFAACLR